jgi:hypothetical protein
MDCSSEVTQLQANCMQFFCAMSVICFDEQFESCNMLMENLFWYVILKGSSVRQKHNCLGVVFIAAMVTTCFGRAWPSSGHNVDVVHK